MIELGIRFVDDENISKKLAVVVQSAVAMLPIGKRA